jgi:hypothetical protein
MVYPHRTIAIDMPLRNKIAAFLTTNYDISRPQALKYLPAELSLWGKLKMPGGSDLIHAWDLVSSYHNSPDSVRDATFIKVYVLFDIEIRSSSLIYIRYSIHSRSTITGISETCLWSSNASNFFGQVRKFIVLTVPVEFPALRNTPARERDQSEGDRTIILAAVAQVTLTRKNALGMVYFDTKSSDLGPASEVIDVGSIDCLVGRIRDSKRWACLVRPDVTAKFKLVEESVMGDTNEA